MIITSLDRLAVSGGTLVKTFELMGDTGVTGIRNFTVENDNRIAQVPPRIFYYSWPAP
jgi:hypothetical protein